MLAANIPQINIWLKIKRRSPLPLHIWAQNSAVFPVIALASELAVCVPRWIRKSVPEVGYELSVLFFFFCNQPILLSSFNREVHNCLQL